MESLVVTLRAVPLFASLPRDVLAQLVGVLEEVSVPAGMTVFARGDQGDAMYIVATGTLEVQIDGKGLVAVGPGQWFGEMALLTGDPRSASVVALSQSQLWRMDKDRFLALSERHPSLLREVTRFLCRRLARVSEDVSEARRVYTQAFETMLAACDADERQLLFHAALLMRPDPLVLGALPDCASAGDRLDSLAARYPAVLRREEDGTYSLHPRLREYLLERLRRDQPQEMVDGLHAHLARIYEGQGQWREAIFHRQERRDWLVVARLIGEAVTSSDPPAEGEVAAWLDRFPEEVLLAQVYLVKLKADVLGRRGQGEAAIALYRRALEAGPESDDAREGLIRGLADRYAGEGRVEEALACLREREDETESTEASAGLQQAAAVRYLTAGRRQEAYAWGRSARTLARGLQGAVTYPLRRSGVLRGGSGIALAFAAGGLVLLLPLHGLSAPAVKLLATLVTAAALWMRGRPPDYVVAIGMGLAWILLGVAPPRTAFGGFTSSAWFLMLGVFGLGAALGRSGLLYRVTLLILRRCPPNFTGQVIAFGLAGVASTLLVPSVLARVTLAGPILVGFSDTVGYPPRSRGSAGVAFAALLGFSLATTLFLTGTSTNLLAWSMLPEATQAEITWGRWFLAVLPLEVLTFAGALMWIIWRSRPETARPARPGLIDAQLEALGPASREERTTLTLMVALLAGWMTQPLHGADPAWIAMGGLCVLVGAGVLDRAAMRSGVDWPLLLFMGSIFSLADLMGRVGLDAWFARLLGQALGGASAYPVAAVVAAILITVGVRFLLPWQTAVPLLTVALSAFALEAQLSPWIVALVALKVGNLFLFPYQNQPYLTLYYGTEERAFTHAQSRPFAWVYAALVLAGFLLSLPYWRALGLA